MCTSEPSRPLRGRRRKNMPDGRRELLRAATVAFAEYGYDGADLRGIAAAANVDAGLVRIHFGAKNGLWLACVDAVSLEAAPMIAEAARLASSDDAPVVERLRRLVVRYVAFSQSHPEVRMFVLRHTSETADRAALLVERLVRPAYAAALPLIAAGIAAGVVRAAHPALFFALLSNALNQPRAASAVLHALAPEIDPTEAPALLAHSIAATFLHDPNGAIP